MREAIYLTPTARLRERQNNDGLAPFFLMASIRLGSSSAAHGETGEGQPYPAMEWLEGVDLDEHLGVGPLDAAESVIFARNVAEALGAAHRVGVIHRDIKPSNLFLQGGSTARIKVLDFGIARATSSRSMTRTGLVVGTPGYLAPEQARGSRAIDSRADVFALGCVLFSCLTARAAFVADDVIALLAKVLAEAIRYQEEAIAVFAAQGDRRLLCSAHGCLSWALRLQGDLEGAEREARLALSTAPAAPSRVPASAFLAAALLAAGRPEEALFAVEEGLKALTAGASEEGEVTLLLAYAESLKRLGG